MPRDGVDVVGLVFQAFAAGDIDLLLPLLDPDVEIKSLMTEAERAIYRGHDGAREWLAAVHEVFPDWRPTMTSVQPVEDGVISEFVATATALASGVPIEQTYWHAARVRDLKLTWFGFYRTESDALAGLRE